MPWVKAIFKIKYFSNEIQAPEMDKKWNLNILFKKYFKSKFQKESKPMALRYFIYNPLCQWEARILESKQKTELYLSLPSISSH